MNGGIFTHINNPHIVLGSGKLADMNPSLVYYKNCYFLNQRIIDYTKLYSSDKFNIYTNSINQFIFNNGISKYNSVNVMTNVSDGRQWVVELPKHGKAAYTGLEDAKFVVWEDELYLYGTRCDVNNGQGNICVYQIDPFNFTVGNEWVVPNNTGVNVEKNWMAIPDKPFCFIYQPNPMTVIEVDPDNCTTRLYGSTKTNELGDNVRGSTPLIRIDTDTYLTLVHTSDGGFDSGGRYQLKYKFKAILLDNDFNVKKTSDLDIGDVGIFSVDGAMYCKLYYIDEHRNLTLVSANPELKRSNVYVSAESSSEVMCCGKVLLNEPVPFPDYFLEE